MRLFELTEDLSQVSLNKVWIQLVPEFKAVMQADKGCKGDYDGRKKLWTTKIFTYIYFYLDFTSPLYNMDDFERREEAMRLAGVTEADMTDVVLNAVKYYNYLLEQSARSLKTLRSLKKGLAKLDEYYESVDFKAADKSGALIYDPKKYIENVKGAGPMYDTIDKFEKRVQEEITHQGSIRGNATLGDNEGKRTGGWSEVEEEPSSSSPAGVDAGATDQPVKTASKFSEVAKKLRKSKSYSKVSGSSESEDEQEPET